ncbi:MAG: glycosyltransferase family 2 protein [Kiloniellaceae bacterium]
MGISYVVTAYNKASYLEDTLSSIEAERSESGGEIVIVDDGSSDDSPRILARFAAENPHATVVTQANKGVVGATNTGFFHSKQNVIRFCDADDLLREGSSRVLLDALDGSDSGLVYGRHETYQSDPENSPISTGRRPAKVLANPLRSALQKNLFSPSSMIVTREVAKSIFPLPEKYRTSQDYMIGLRACFSTRMAKLEEALSLGPDHYEDRLSSDKARMYGETAQFVSEEILGNLDRWNESDARYALKRTAGRAILWSRRTGSRPPYRKKLFVLKYATRLRGKAAAAQALSWIAENIYNVR